MDVLRLTIWLLYLCITAMVALAEAAIFIRFNRTPPYQSRLDTAIFHYSVIGLNGSNLCNKNGCSILCEVDGQTLTSCPANSIVLNNLTVNLKHHFRLNVTTKDGKRNSSSYRWFIDTIPPTATIFSGQRYTSGEKIAIYVTFSEACTGSGSYHNYMDDFKSPTSRCGKAFIGTKHCRLILESRWIFFICLFP